LTDSELVRQTLARYWVYLDDRLEEEWLDLFDDACVLEFGETVARSRPELERIAAGFKNYPGGKHLSSNELVQIDGDEAAATSDVVFMEPDSHGTVGIRYYGRCVDRLARRGEQWCFVSRRIVFQGGHHD
jgi:3-phenylpropionate/cinnamic acid dioxygenase small subunit